MTYVAQAQAESAALSIDLALRDAAAKRTRAITTSTKRCRLSYVGYAGGRNVRTPANDFFR